MCVSYNAKFRTLTSRLYILIGTTGRNALIFTTAVNDQLGKNLKAPLICVSPLRIRHINLHSGLIATTLFFCTYLLLHSTTSVYQEHLYFSSTWLNLRYAVNFQAELWAGEAPTVGNKNRPQSPSGNFFVPPFQAVPYSLFLPKNTNIESCLPRERHQIIVRVEQPARPIRSS